MRNNIANAAENTKNMADGSRNDLSTDPIVNINVALKREASSGVQQQTRNLAKTAMTQFNQSNNTILLQNDGCLLNLPQQSMIGLIGS